MLAVKIVYFGGVAAFAALIVFLGSTGRWSKDDWPVFAISVPWVWPLLLPAMFAGLFMDNVVWPLIDRRPVVWNPLKWGD